MAFEDYQDLDLKPEKATREEIEQLSKKYGVSEFYDSSSRAREFLRRKEKNVKVRIQKDVPITIFDEPILAKQVDNLFNGAEKKMKARVKEIINFLDMDSTDELSYDNIAFLFKVYFFKSILNEAIEITFESQENYDILSNILSLLSKEKMETAIMGKPMIDAFSKAIRSIPSNSGVRGAICGSKIQLLERKFL